MMKKLRLVLLAVATLTAHSLAAQALPGQGLSFGGGVVLEQQFGGGFGEFGFPLLTGEGFDVRNTLSVHGLGSVGVGLISLHDKVQIGGFTLGKYRQYGFIEGGWGSNLSRGWFWTALGGGGLDLFVSTSSTYFAEFGGGARSEGTGYAFLRMGTRYFN